LVAGPTLSVWINEENNVAVRLFGKLGFKEDGRTNELRIPVK